MKIVNKVRMIAAAGLLSGLLATSAVAQEPDAHIQFGGDSVAFIASGTFGGGHLRFHGRDTPIKVSGVGIGAIGVNHFSAEGDVFHLHHVQDIAGTYTALNASATAGGGAGWIDMQNEHGVEIRAHSTSEGLALSLAPSGMLISIP